MTMANWILIILTVGLLIATIIYVVHTRRLANETKRMADASEKDQELREKTRLDFDVGGRMTSSEGIDVQFKFFNAGEFSLKLKLIVFTWWFKNRPRIRHTIEKTFERTIHKQEPLEEWIQFDEYEFRKHEIEEVKSLEGGHFYARISGILRVEYLDVNDKPKHEERSLENLI